MVIIVTGASSGIGRSLVRFFAQKGHHVYGLSRSKFIEDQVESLQCDVTNLNDIEKTFAYIFKKEGRIDALINNAGMGISGSIEDTLKDDAETLFNVNFLGVFLTTKAVLPYMREGGAGKIFNISSVASRLSIPFQSFYSASKAAINTFSEALANEVAPFNIGVCVILPGDIRTNFTMNRKKNRLDGPLYRERIAQSIQVMEADEQNGMDPSVLSKVVGKLLKKKRLPLYKTIGVKYKIFILLHKLLPAKLTNAIVGSIYGFKKTKPED